MYATRSSTRAGLAVTLDHADEEQVEKRGDSVVRDAPDVALEAARSRCRKSRYNVVNPDDMSREYGADAMRLVRAVHGPARGVKPWEPPASQARAGS